MLSYAETERIQSLMARHGVVGLSPLQLRRVLADAGAPLKAGALRSSPIPSAGAGGPSVGRRRATGDGQ